jgi:hypothetical protein
MNVAPEEISAHVERRIGPVATVFHEIVSDDLHIDVHHVRSTLFRRYEVLVTSGMSAKPMATPDEAKQFQFAEVLVVLPKGWPLAKADFENENAYWPIRLLKNVARFPHHAKTWISFGHTVANGDSESGTTPYAPSTGLCASILLPSSTLGEKAWSFKSRTGAPVHLWAAVPIYMDELKFKLEHGTDELLNLFDKCQITDRIDPTRLSAVE